MSTPILDQIRLARRNGLRGNVVPRVVMLTRFQATKLEDEISEKYKIPKNQGGGPLWQVYGLLILRKDAEILDLREIKTDEELV